MSHINEFMESDDEIYHYTRMSIVVKRILPNMSLKIW